MRVMQYAKNIKVLGVQMDALPLQVLVDDFLFLLDGLAFPVNFLEYDSHEIHLAL